MNNFLGTRNKIFHNPLGSEMFYYSAIIGGGEGAGSYGSKTEFCLSALSYWQMVKIGKYVKMNFTYSSSTIMHKFPYQSVVDVMFAECSFPLQIPDLMATGANKPRAVIARCPWQTSLCTTDLRLT